MKDYESYNNKGNKEIKDNPELKSKEFYSRQFQDNVLPGEYFDCRVNGLECELNDDNKFAYKESESRSSHNSTNDFQDLSNAVNSSSSSATSTTTAASNASIVESAGTVVTGAATAVVGAAAAVVAFNAIPKDPPKMLVNRLEAGSTYVYYDLNFENLDTDKEYDIVIKNPYHSFKIECSNGNQDGYVYDLKPGLSYTLSFIGPHSLFGTAEYGSETFYTLPSEEIFATPTIDLVYNSDLTCDVNFKSVVYDDYNKLDKTYVSVSQDDIVLFDSYKLEDYPGVAYNYDSKTKTHSGTVKRVETGLISFSTYLIDPDTGKRSVLETITKQATNPLSHKTGANFISLSGDNNLIKEIMDSNRDLYIRVNLFDEEDKVTPIESKVDLSGNKFNYKTVVRQDTIAYSYQVGYYENNEFVVLNQIAKTEFVQGDYDATYLYVLPKDENLINVKWKYNDIEDVSENGADYELADITLLTDFDNNGNNDEYYRVELIRTYFDYDTEQYVDVLVDTYEGTGNAVFNNIPVGDYNIEDGSYNELYSYKFRYTSLMNYYTDGSEYDVVEVSVREPETSDDELYFPYGISFGYDGGFELLSNGKLAFRVYSMADVDPVDRKPIEFGSNISLKILNYEEDYSTITEVIDITDLDVVNLTDGSAVLAFDLDSPNPDSRGYYVEFEIPYYEKYGGNIRLVKSDGKKLVGDRHYLATPSEIYQEPSEESYYVKIKLATYKPDNYVVKARDNMNNEYPAKTDTDGSIYYDGTFHDEDLLIFDIYNENNELIANYVYTYVVHANNSNEFMQYFALNDFTSDRFGLDNIVYTYNNAKVSDDGNDGTVNINLLTGFDNPNPDNYDVYIDYRLYKEDDVLGDILVGEVLNSTSKVINFNSSETYQFNYLDSFRIQYKVHLDSKTLAYGAYKAHYESDWYLCNVFTFANSYIMTDEVDMKPQLYSEEDHSLTLEIANEYIYPHEQTVVFDVHDDAIDPVELELSECISQEYDYGRKEYTFVVSEDIYNYGIMYFTIKGNYTLTDGKLEALGNNYEGDLYCEFTYRVTGA